MVHSQQCLAGVFVPFGVLYHLWLLQQCTLFAWPWSLLALLVFTAETGSLWLVRARFRLWDPLDDSASCQLALYSPLGACHILHPAPDPNHTVALWTFTSSLPSHGPRTLSEHVGISESHPHHMGTEDTFREWPPSPVSAGPCHTTDCTLICLSTICLPSPKLASGPDGRQSPLLASKVAWTKTLIVCLFCPTFFSQQALGTRRGGLPTFIHPGPFFSCPGEQASQPRQQRWGGGRENLLPIYRILM